MPGSSTFINSTSATGSGSSIVINTPASIASGDLLVIVVQGKWNGSGAPVWSTPSGWSRVGVNATGVSGHYPYQVFRKAAGGSEPVSVTVSSTVALAESVGMMLAYRGVSTTVSTNQLNDQATSSSSLVNKTSGNTHSTGSLVLVIDYFGDQFGGNLSAFSGMAPFFTHPSGYIEHGFVVGTLLAAVVASKDVAATTDPGNLTTTSLGGSVNCEEQALVYFSLTDPDVSVSVTGVAGSGAVGSIAYTVDYYLDSALTSASSQYIGNPGDIGFDGFYPPSAVNNNQRKGSDFNSQGDGNLWCPAALPADMDITFPAARTVDKVTIYSPQQTLTAVEPTTTLTTLYAVKNFTVQTWNGASWDTQATVISNIKVMRECTFAAVSTTAVRLHITVGNGVPNHGASPPTGVAEIECWGTNDGQYRNVALRARGGLFTTAMLGTVSVPMNVFIDTRGPPFNAYLGFKGTGVVGNVFIRRTSTVPITGVAAVGAVGTPTPSNRYAVSGLQAAGALGSIGHTVLYRALPVAAVAGQLGSISAGWVQQAPVTGVQATTALNPPSVMNYQTFNAPMSASTHGAVGAVGFQISSSTLPAGVAGIGHVGAPRMRVDALPSAPGVIATGAIGTPGIGQGVEQLAVVGAGQLGAVGFQIDCRVSPLGLQAAGLVGVPGNRRDGSARVIGVSATGTAGLGFAMPQSQFNQEEQLFTRTPHR